ncbi:MAG: hypothetical protein AAFY41_05760, partial [Bacteroidota bacterium]
WHQRSDKQGVILDSAFSLFKVTKEGYTTEPNKLQPPQYIAEGLKWLESKLAEGAVELTETEATKETES